MYREKARHERLRRIRIYIGLVETGQLQGPHTNFLAKEFGITRERARRLILEANTVLDNHQHRLKDRVIKRLLL